MNPSSRNLFMKVHMRDRVVPTISASVSWLIFAMTGAGSVPCQVGHQEKHPCQTLFARIETLIDQIFLDAIVPSQS
jgi:hypothetical protein